MVAAGAGATQRASGLLPLLAAASSGAMDTGGFVTAFMLAATALGVGSIAQASVAAYAPFIRAHFALPETRHMLCAISFGWPDPDHPANGFRTTRAALSEVLDLRG